MFQVFRRIGSYLDPCPLSPTFDNFSAAYEWAEEYLRNHPRGCGAEAVDIRRVSL